MEGGSEDTTPPFLAVEKVVDNVGVYFDSHVPGILFFKRCAAQITDTEGGATHQHNFVLERFWWHGSIEYIPHRVVLVSVVRTREVNENAAIVPGLQAVAAELDALEPLFRNISFNLLVPAFLLFP